jgi:hypothetical protein
MFLKHLKSMLTHLFTRKRQSKLLSCNSSMKLQELRKTEILWGKNHRLLAYFVLSCRKLKILGPLQWRQVRVSNFVE